MKFPIVPCHFSPTVLRTGFRSVSCFWWFSLDAFLLMSQNRDGHVDVAPNSIGIGADFVCRLNQFFGLFLVDSYDGHLEGGKQHKATRLVATETNFSNHFDVFVRKPEPLLAAYTQERVLEAGGIAAGEKRLWVSCISLAAELAGQGQLHIKQPVFAADMAMTAASCRDFCAV